MHYFMMKKSQEYFLIQQNSSIGWSHQCDYDFNYDDLSG